MLNKILKYNIYLIIKDRRIIPPYSNHLNQQLYRLTKQQLQDQDFQQTVLYILQKKIILNRESKYKIQLNFLSMSKIDFF